MSEGNKLEKSIQKALIERNDSFSRAIEYLWFVYENKGGKKKWI
jgi:hypothetical protein